MTEEEYKRFAAKFIEIESNGCWFWLGYRMPNGYGQFQVSGKLELAHRASYEHHIGPLNGERALHTCDNKWCVNPHHIEAGTQRKNIQDAVARGLIKTGGRSHAARLTAQEVMAIIADPRPHRQIAPEYGIAHQHVSRLKRGERWNREGDLRV